MHVRVLTVVVKLNVLPLCGQSTSWLFVEPISCAVMRAIADRWPDVALLHEPGSPYVGTEIVLFRAVTLTWNGSRLFELLGI